MNLEFKLDGAKELDELLKQLPANVARRVSANALRAAGRDMRDEMKRQVPVETGDLKRSIKVITAKAAGRDKRNVRVGVFGKEVPLAHLVEFGSAAHKIATKVKRVLFDAGAGKFFGREVSHPGTPARPFIRPAADAQAGRAVETIGKVLAEGIEREALKLGKRR